MLEQLDQVRLVRWYYSEAERQSFAMPEDTYDHWALLAPDQGGFHYRVGEDSGTVQFGEFVLCPPGYTLERRAFGPLTFLFIEFRWSAADGRPVVPGPRQPYGKIAIHRTKRYASTFACIRELGSASANARSGYKQHLLQDLLFLVALEQQEAEAASASDDPLVQRAAAYLQQHAFESLSLQALARQARLSQSQFSRRFQAAMGVSPLAYLTALRLRKARNLLLETELPLEQIALQCGYQSGFYLSRIFTRAMGMSPSDYRKTHRV